MIFSLLIIANPGLRAQNGNGFLEQQLRYPRVRAAMALRDSTLREAFRSADLEYPPRNIFIRVFKQELLLEVWVLKDSSYRLFREYGLCAGSGSLGPKRKQGDKQIPEGVYHIDRFNASSRYHLSLGIDYPNPSDRVHGDARKPGGDIFIHGSCASIGCVSVHDEEIEEVYLLAVHASSSGQSEIPVHIFPLRMDPIAVGGLKNANLMKTPWHNLWDSLQPVYRAFEKSHRVPQVRIDEQGWYQVVE